MSEWTVVSVLVTLVGLCAAVIRPLMSLNGVITRLTGAVNTLEKNIAALAEKNSETHGRIWDKVGEQDELLRGHEARLVMIECAGTRR